MHRFFRAVTVMALAVGAADMSLTTDTPVNEPGAFVDALIGD